MSCPWFSGHYAVMGVYSPSEQGKQAVSEGKCISTGPCSPTMNQGSSSSSTSNGNVMVREATS